MLIYTAHYIWDDPFFGQSEHRTAFSSIAEMNRYFNEFAREYTTFLDVTVSIRNTEF